MNNLFKILFAMIVMAAAVETALAVPAVTGDPVIIKHVGSMSWPGDKNGVVIPYLTQGDANAVNDLHGEASCDVNISTPGNYHMALQDLLYGRADLGHASLIEQIRSTYGATVCWTTSPPINQEQIPVEVVQFGNVRIIGKPVLAMGPGGKMNNLVRLGLVDATTVKNFMRNRGNALLVRKEEDKHEQITSVCDLGNEDVRLATPRPPARPGEESDPAAEPGSFGNFSGTVYNTINSNPSLPCHADAEKIFNSFFAQDLSQINLTGLNNTFNHKNLVKVYKKSKWVASSRIMHRDVPYALCNNYADAGVIFFHQAKYLKREAAKFNCELDIVDLPAAGNRIGTLKIAKVAGTFSENVSMAAELIYGYMTAAGGVWETILNEHGMDFPQ